MEKYNKPLQRSILLGCMLFIVPLSLILGIVTYIEYRHALYARYEEYIGDMLKYNAGMINVDDIQQCLETGKKSEHFEDIQERLDLLRDTCDIHFIYMIIPLNTTGYDNIMNVMAGASQEEKETIPDQLVVLGGLTADAYSPETAAKYYNAINTQGEISFFKETSAWGTDYTGTLPLVNSKGEFFALLCVDVPVDTIYSTIRRFAIANILLVLLLATMFILVFISWISRNVVKPIKLLEGSAVNFAKRSHRQRSLEELTFEIPEIHTDNEVESLAHAIVKMADDMKDYVSDVIEAEREAEKMKNKATLMSELANKDALTGIKNMTAYDYEVELLEKRMQEGAVEFGVVMVDLNWLKRINDSYGHDKGNVSLQRLSSLLCNVFSESSVFRIGGDEFVAIVVGRDYHEIKEREKTFFALLDRQGDVKNMKPWEHISASMGYSLYDPDTDTCFNDVFERADKAMYANKMHMHKQN